MQVVGIVCEYNPFHNGHAKQLAAIDGAAVCLMSGNYVQRGEPALLDRLVRAEAAVRCGAALVLELPVTYALRSAEGFAAGGMELMDRLGCIDAICFGTESGDTRGLMETAKTLLDPAFSPFLKAQLARGLSFPAARARALAAMGADAALLERPNDILGVEYCKALLARGSAIRPLPIRREGAYHGGSEPANPSASYLRSCADWRGFVPAAALACCADAPRYTVAAGERAWLARLRAMEEADFAALPYGSEGLWRKVMHACRTRGTLGEIVGAAKSKRYTHTRLMRMLLCAFLGISAALLEQPAPYVRILAMDDRGRRLLRQMHETSSIPLLHPGQTPPEGAYAALERRAADLYGLFREGTVAAPGRREQIRYCPPAD